jgi:hypothetical protein
MLENNLLQAIQSIEKLGKQFNETPEEVIQERLFEYDEYLPRQALEPIKKYMVTHNIKVGNFNWDDYFFSFVDEDDEYFISFSNEVDALRINAMGSYPTYKEMPLELILLFRTLGTSFHLEEYQPHQKKVCIDIDSLVLAHRKQSYEIAKVGLTLNTNPNISNRSYSELIPNTEVITIIENLFKYFDIYLLLSEII